ncbi:MAG: nucleotidyltransferase family protein [Metallibacterium scheffleri]|jgi:D-glycero-alpha-D-manno-heptose 1-phosphate guanylyltransferase|uniref:nucleotidyltransferase family protein n=1 Tax=Metallibacterium scheffleri TaxID=993689 RepID=UPI0026F1A2B4|nr:nucleotidyltransferase family protein [Metallibacterium scheffleri]MCK9366939.1 nucleotidyltransferase family protein [Metallibacterium scheffleri]
MAAEAIILAGGRGTRLQGVVSDVPKPLAPVQGRPFLAWLLDLLAQQGMRRVVVAAGYKAEMVHAAIGEHWHGMRIDYAVEPTPLGTGGAIAQALQRIEGEDAFVLNGDTYLELDYTRFAAAMRAQHAGLGIALARVPDVSRYGAVHVVDERVAGFSEKGGSGAGWINAGVYWLPHSLPLPTATQAFSFEDIVLRAAASQGTLRAYTMTDAFIDIGVPEDFQRAQAWRFVSQASPVASPHISQSTL